MAASRRSATTQEGSALPARNAVSHGTSSRGCTLRRVDPAVDLEILSAAAKRILDAGAPGPLRQMAAKGFAPGIRPGEALTIVALLAESEDAALAATARATLDKLPAPLLAGALGGALPGGVLAGPASRSAT